MSSYQRKIQYEGLTYDDVLIIPAYSNVLPKDVSIETKFSKNILLKTPIVSAAMDTVTESKMAIAIAREGGIGVLHKNITIEKQAKEVKRVKRAESGMILDPITVSPNSTVANAKKIMKEFGIGGIPVVTEKTTLIGIVTNRDLRFEKNNAKFIKEVMTSKNIITTAENTSLLEAEEILQKHKIEKLPVVNKKNELIGLITYKDITQLKEQPNSCKDEFGRLRVAAGIGITIDSLERAQALVKENVDALVLDSAHGHSKRVIDLLKKLKNQFPKVDIVVGNIATEEAAKELIKGGADALKVGIGPGSICTTRIIAGVGVPQLSAILNVVKIAKEKKIPVIADGGIRFSGDIVKALTAGADCVMLGSLLAGVEESPGETVIYEGRKYKTYRGMGSIDAMQEGSKDRYFQDMENDIKKLVPEGIVGRVPYKGKLNELMYQHIGGIKSGMGYAGAKNISKLKKAHFTRITNAGMQESHPHNVDITREAPNYSR